MTMLLKAVLPRKSEIKIEMRKASFGGDRSEAGRYAANVRWQNQASEKELYTELDENEFKRLGNETGAIDEAENFRDARISGDSSAELWDMDKGRQASLQFYVQTSQPINYFLRNNSEFAETLFSPSSKNMQTETRYEIYQKKGGTIVREFQEGDPYVKLDNEFEERTIKPNQWRAEDEIRPWQQNDVNGYSAETTFVPIANQLDGLSVPIQVVIAKIDDAFKNMGAVLPVNTKLHRGIDPSIVQKLLDMPDGTSFTENTFVSTSIQKETAAQFSNTFIHTGYGSPSNYSEFRDFKPPKNTATILVKKGTKVVFPDANQSQSEGEVLLNRGSTFKKIGQNDDGPILELLDDVNKASFNGDRSEAGRYAANIRWQGNNKKEETESTLNADQLKAITKINKATEYVKSKGFKFEVFNSSDYEQMKKLRKQYSRMRDKLLQSKRPVPKDDVKWSKYTKEEKENYYYNRRIGSGTSFIEDIIQYGSEDAMKLYHDKQTQFKDIYVLRDKNGLIAAVSNALTSDSYRSNGVKSMMIDLMGSTQIVKGAGSALFSGMVKHHAKQNGYSISFDVADDALEFWQGSGVEIQSYGGRIASALLLDVKEFAKELT